MSVPKAEQRKMKRRIRISVVAEKAVLCSHVMLGALRSDSSSGRASPCPLPSVPQGVHRFPEHAAGPNDMAQGSASRPAVTPPRVKEELLPCTSDFTSLCPSFLSNKTKIIIQPCRVVGQMRANIYLKGEEKRKAKHSGWQLVSLK